MLDKCGADMRKDLTNNLLLTGGGSQFKFMPERLQREVAALLPAGFKVRVVCPDAAEHRQGVWVGGSILASLGSFQQRWLSKAQYDELGPARAARKFADA